MSTRLFLTVITSILLFILIYINIHAFIKSSHGAHDDHNAFLRILQESVDGSHASTSGTEVEGLDKSDREKVKTLDEKMKGMAEFLDELNSKIGRLTSGTNARLNNGNTVLDTQDKQSLHEKAERLKQPSSSANHEQRLFRGLNNEQPKKSESNLESNGSESNEQPLKKTGFNILLLYADDWTHHTLSSFHKTQPLNKILKTPTLDALSQDGIRFTHNCVTTSVCWISRATLFTGQYMSRHKTTQPCCWGGMSKPKEKMKEPPKNWMDLSVYELLKKEGYHVGHVGKWGVYMPWPKNVDFNVEDDGWHYRQFGDKLWHITEKNEADALRFLVTRPRDKPFFLNVAFFATHAKDSDIRQYMPQNSSMNLYAEDEIPIPPTGTDEAWKKMPWFFSERNEGRIRWKARFSNYTQHQHMMKNYYRMATEVDSACGIILEELRRQGELDNTFIIFTTDNGNFHSEHGLADKWYPHQESIRTPLIIRDPRMKAEDKGTTNDAFTLNIDLAPTILAAAGISPPEKYMGQDMSQLYLKQSAYNQWRKEFFYEHPIVSTAHYIPSSEALVRKDFKYMYWPDFDFEQLFDLKTDPGELEDLANSTDPEMKDVLREMKSRFVELKKLVKSDEIISL